MGLCFICVGQKLSCKPCSLFYFILALVVDSFETGTPLIPFSPGWLLPLSMPTLVEPESEATGASPGALLSPWTIGILVSME